MQNYVEVFKVRMSKKEVLKNQFYFNRQKNFMASSLQLDRLPAVHSVVLLFFHGNFNCVIGAFYERRYDTYRVWGTSAVLLIT